MAKSSEKELVEYIPKDTEDEEGANGDDDCDTEAITKDEEWITKRKTELTTTRQIETRVKRQVLLEDGKVVEDSGPIVSTNTTEDTDKQETETTEKRDLGIPVTDSGGGLQAVTASENPAAGQQLSEFGNGKAVTKMVPRPADGLVRQINDKLVISHEEIKDYTETEDVKHLGDFSDEAYVKAVNSGADNLQEVLLSEANQKQLIPLGPRLIANTSKSRKVIDSEDSEKRCLAQADGKIVTEHKKTTEHEVILDEELPDKDDLSTGSREKVTTKEAHQRFYKQRDEQHVDRLVDGKVISTEMRYAADSMQMEKDSSLERPGDWDSLSDRMRKLRRTNQKSLLQQQKAALLAERKDALTKRPLDFDREEETRKGETMKWLESHFGSESTASNDSRDGDEGPDAAIEPTKKTFFNVTIKSNLGQTPQSHGPPPREARLSATAATDAYERKYHSQVVATGSSGPNTGAPPNSRSKYYQGITNWTERKDQLPAKHFASKAFRDDLQDTIERNRLRKMSANGQAVYSSRDKLNSLERERERYGGPAAEHAGKVGVASGPNDTYVSRDDILHQKRRQSLSLQFLNKTRRSSSRDHLDDLPEMEPPIAPVAAVNQREPLHNGSFTDLRYGQKVKREEETVHRSSYSSGVKAVVGHPQRSEFIDGRAKSFERGLDMELDHEEHMMMAGGRRGGYDVPKGYQTLKPTTTTSATMRTNGSDSDHLAVNGGSSTLGRPTVPQRRRAIEKKLRQQSSSTTPPLQPPPQGMATPLRKGSYEQQHRDFAEPPPDYSPPPRSRSSSPQVDYNLQRRRRSHSRDRSAHDLDSQGPMQPAAATSMSTLQRKQQQRTRFAPEPPSSSYHQQRPTMSTQTTQTIPAAASSSGHKSHSKMGQAIGNSIRKLVSKIRSASAERKMRLKRSKSREQSPSPPHATSAGNATSSTTYQQYNVIDGHIGGAGGGNTESEQESLAGGEPIGADKMNGYHSNGNKIANGFRRADSADPFISLKDSDGGIANPRQRYYLGEDPYSSRLYGKENHHPYNGNGVGQRQQKIDREQHEEAYTQQRYTSSNTLGRFQKSGGQRAVAGSTPNLHQDYYRTAQTLPRKLHEQTNGSRQPSASPMNSSSRYMTNGSHTLGHPDRRGQYQQATQVAVGPAKPARTYQKVLNRSKSFNVHAMNGGTDPSPIYMEKLTRNNYPATPTSNLHYSQTYKSNPHLFSGGGGGAGGGYRDRLSGERENSLQSGLKSPSIVNLISRSQKDLSKIGTGHDEEPLANGHRTPQPLAADEKKQIFLRGLHQQAPDLYRTLHGEEVEYREKSPAVRQQLQPKYSLDSRSPIEINKDTASIMRRDSAGANEDYAGYPYGRQMEGQRRFQAFKEEQRRRGSGSTIIELRHTDPRK